MVESGINLDDKVNTIKEQLQKIEKLSKVEEELKNLVGNERDLEEEKSGLRI